MTGRFGGYARYRLRYLAVLTLLSTLLHGLEVELMLAAYPFEELLPLIAYRAGTALVIPWWWGALEQLRDEVRQRVRTRQFRRASDRIEAWLGVSFWLGLAAPSLMVGWLWLNPTGPRHPNLYDIYAFCCALRLGVDLAVRTYHAGIFATRRVYRPLWSVAVPTLLEGGGLIVLWFWLGLGVWALPAALMLGMVARHGLTLVFTRRAYRDSRLAKVGLARALRSPLAVGKDAALSAARFALANSTSQLDGLIIVVLVTQPERPGAAAFALLYYVLSPLMGTAHKWCRVFYFDLQRLAQTSHDFLRLRMLRELRALAWWSGLGIAASTLALGSLVLRADVAMPALALAPLFVARSHFSLTQLQAFTHHQGKKLALLAALVLLAVLVLSRTHAPAYLVVLDVSGVLGLGAWLAGRRVASSAPRPTEGRLGLYRFLRELAGAEGAVRLGVARVDRKLARVRDTTRALAAAFPEGTFCALGRADVLLRLPGDEPALQSALHSASGGVLSDLEVLHADSGKRALEVLRQRAPWPSWLKAQLESGPRDADALRHACRALGGHVIELDVVEGRAHRRPVWSRGADRRGALDVLAGEGEGLLITTRGGPVACAHSPGGDLRWAFVWPRSRPDVLSLRDEVRARNVVDSQP